MEILEKPKKGKRILQIVLGIFNLIFAIKLISLGLNGDDRYYLLVIGICVMVIGLVSIKKAF